MPVILLPVVIVATSVWVWADARALGVPKLYDRGQVQLAPFEWFVLCLLFWPITFPVYLARRRSFRELRKSEES